MTIFISCSIESVRVGPKNLGPSGYQKHTNFIFWPYRYEPGHKKL